MEAGPTFDHMGSTSVTPFTGSSAFASQLAQVIQTAVARASAPITQLQTEQSTLQAEQSELQTLTTDFGSLQSALGAITTASTTGALSAEVSDSSVASASVGSGALAGTYSLTVVSLGSQANAISEDGLTTVTDPTSQNFDSASSYTLTVEGQTYTIKPTSNTLDNLVQAINDSGANVQATVVNEGSAGSPDYRLSIQSNDYTNAGIQLSDGTNNLLETLSPGASFQYQVNGEPKTPITATSPDVTISPGLTVTMLVTGTTTIYVSASTSAVSNALRNFVSAYNTVAGELGKNRGQNGGALAGQSVIYELQNNLSQLVTSSTGSGNITSLSDLGFTFDNSGNLSFDPFALTSANASDVLNFLGTATSGGFLENATNILNGVTDSTTGILTTDSQNISNELTKVGTQISDDQANVSNLQTTLTQQMATADAAISSLEQEVNEMTDLFTSMQQDSKNVTG